MAKKTKKLRVSYASSNHKGQRKVAEFDTDKADVR